MKRRTFYLALAVFFGIGILAILFFPEPTLIVLVGGVPLAIGAAIVSVWYCRRVYLRQPEPRSRFFGMLLETFYAKVIFGLWVGYLSIARVTERAAAEGNLDWTVPAPGTLHSSPITALLIIVIFAGPTRFGLEIYRERRRAESTPSTLDRENGGDSEGVGSRSSEPEGGLDDGSASR